jgi:ABC-type Fe3+-hydroxamate transport system substrate-binding protein
MPVFRFRRARSIVAAATLAASALACGNRSARSPSDSARAAAPARPLPSRDDFGRPLPAGAARRIVSLNPTTTELLFAIGAGARLVGRSQYDVFPDSARLVPSLGPALRPNLEAVLAVHPDLVLLYANEDNREALDRLTRAGVAVAAFKIDSIEQFERDTRIIARMTGDSARAAVVVDSIASTLAHVRAATAGLARPTVFIPTWDRPIIAIGGGSFMSELLDIAGARNVYADINGPSATVAIEDVVRRNPDIVLVTPASAAAMRTNARWRAIPAVRAGRILVYDTTLVSRPSVLLGAAARSLAELFHPGAVR